MDKHPAFLELISFEPTLSVARAVLGPFVRIRQLGGRVSYPGEPNQETQWHLHRRTVPKPLPAFFSFPHTLDCLIYLDELNDAMVRWRLYPDRTGVSMTRCRLTVTTICRDRRWCGGRRGHVLSCTAIYGTGPCPRGLTVRSGVCLSSVTADVDALFSLWRQTGGQPRRCISGRGRFRNERAAGGRRLSVGAISRGLRMASDWP